MTQKDYLTELLQNMQGQIASLDKKQDLQSKKLDKIHEQTIKTNGRTNSHAEQLKRIWSALKKLGNNPPATAKASILEKLDNKFFFIVALTFLILVAAGVGPETVRQVKELVG